MKNSASTDSPCPAYSSIGYLTLRRHSFYPLYKANVLFNSVQHNYFWMVSATHRACPFPGVGTGTRTQHVRLEPDYTSPGRGTTYLLAKPEMPAWGMSPCCPAHLGLYLPQSTSQRCDIDGFPRILLLLKSGTACLLLRNFFIGDPPYLATTIWLFMANREGALNNIFLTFYNRQYTQVVHEIFTITQSKTIYHLTGLRSRNLLLSPNYW